MPEFGSIAQLVEHPPETWERGGSTPPRTTDNTMRPWRNGRRAALRWLCPIHGRVGSTPTGRTFEQASVAQGIAHSITDRRAEGSNPSRGATGSGPDNPEIGL